MKQNLQFHFKYSTVKMFLLASLMGFNFVRKLQMKEWMKMFLDVHLVFCYFVNFGKGFGLDIKSKEMELIMFLSSVWTDCDRKSTVWYISTEDSCPDWVTRCLNKGEWCKGKLLCPKCHGRLGSFDFTSSQRCPCGVEICPPIHINKNRVDCFSEKLDMETEITHWEKENTEGAMKDRCGSGEPGMAVDRVVSPPGSCSCVPAAKAQSVEHTQTCDGAKNVCNSKCEERVAGNSIGTDISRSGNIENRNHAQGRNLQEKTRHNTQPEPNSDQSPSTGVSSEAHGQRFSSRRKPRHKRVASDCSWQRDKQCFDFAATATPPNNNLPRSTNSCGSLNSISGGSEEGLSRHHGNRGAQISTSLLRKRYGHRRAQSMTVTSNRFEFLLQDDDSQVLSVSCHWNFIYWPTYMHTAERRNFYA